MKQPTGMLYSPKLGTEQLSMLTLVETPTNLTPTSEVMPDNDLWMISAFTAR